MTSRKTRTVVFVQAMLAGLVLWVFALWAKFVFSLPFGVLVALGAFLVLAMLVLERWVARAPEPPDALSPWRGERLIRDLRLHANGLQDQTLTLELAAWDDPATTVATLRFEGVRDLRLQQLADWAQPFDDLRCRDLGDGRRDGVRFQVRDVANDAVAFRCRSFAERREGPTTAEAMAGESAGG